MNPQVQKLLLDINKVLSEKDADVGDVALWFYDKFLNKETTKDMVSNTPVETTKQEIAPSEQILNNKIKEQPSKDITTFAKRAGADKFKQIVKNIQKDNIDVDMSVVGDEEVGLEDENVDPLSSAELSTVNSLFENTSRGFDLKEIQKLQKLEEFAATGSVGKIRRSS